MGRTLATDRAPDALSPLKRHTALMVSGCCNDPHPVGEYVYLAADVEAREAVIRQREFWAGFLANWDGTKGEWNFNGPAAADRVGSAWEAWQKHLAKLAEVSRG